MINVQKIEARLNCTMTREDLIKLFDNEYTKQGCMFKDDPDSLIDTYETDKLLEINVLLKNNHKITVFYGQATVYIDLSSNDYIGLGNTVIYNKPEEIVEIEVKWR